MINNKLDAVVSKLKTLRKIEPYKGKGVREKGQYVLKKKERKNNEIRYNSKRKRFRVSNKVKKVASKDRFRLSISRSSKNISAQIIDDSKNITLNFSIIS